jgi:hypothetical protein
MPLTDWSATWTTLFGSEMRESWMHANANNMDIDFDIDIDIGNT